MVKAFVDVERSPGIRYAGDLTKLKLDGGVVPSVGRSYAGDAGEHVGVAPSVDPGV